MAMPSILDGGAVINGYYNLRGGGAGAFNLHRESFRSHAPMPSSSSDDPPL